MWQLLPVFQGKNAFVTFARITQDAFGSKRLPRPAITPEGPLQTLPAALVNASFVTTTQTYKPVSRTDEAPIAEPELPVSAHDDALR